MSIDLHCPGCQKLIRAPDNAGGRHGKCPYCGRKVYIPMPENEVELFDIAEPDEDEARQEEQLRRESTAYAAGLAHAEGQIPATADEGMGGDAPRRPEVPGEVIDIAAEVEMFLAAMRDSQLDQADAAVARLKRSAHRAKDYIESAMVDEIPPQIDGVPPPVMKGFLKTLLGRL